MVFFHYIVNLQLRRINPCNFSPKTNGILRILLKCLWSTEIRAKQFEAPENQLEKYVLTIQILKNPITAEMHKLSSDVKFMANKKGVKKFGLAMNGGEKRLSFCK